MIKECVTCKKLPNALVYKDGLVGHGYSGV